MGGMDWDGPRYQVAAITAAGVVLLKLSWPLVARAWYKLGYLLGVLARHVATRKQPARSGKQPGDSPR